MGHRIETHPNNIGLAEHRRGNGEKRPPPPIVPSRRDLWERLPELLFLAALGAYALALFLSMGPLAPAARLFPSLTLLAAAVLWTIRVIAVLSPRLRDILDPSTGLYSALNLDGVPEAPEGAGEAAGQRRRAPPGWHALAWLGAVILLMVLFGILAATAAAVFVYLRVMTGESRALSLGVAVATALFVYVVFVVILHVDPNTGIVPVL